MGGSEILFSPQIIPRELDGSPVGYKKEFFLVYEVITSPCIFINKNTSHTPCESDSTFMGLLSRSVWTSWVGFTSPKTIKSNYLFSWIGCYSTGKWLRSYYEGNDLLREEVDSNYSATKRSGYYDRRWWSRRFGYESHTKIRTDLKSEEQLGMKGLFEVTKDGDKQILSLDRRLGNLKFKCPEDPELLYPRLSTQLEKKATKDICIYKL